MTGGAGFSRQAAQSFKDNHDLGRIRPQGKLELKARSGKNAEELQLKEAIIFRTQKRSEAKLLNRNLAASMLRGTCESVTSLHS